MAHPRLLYQAKVPSDTATQVRFLNWKGNMWGNPVVNPQCAEDSQSTLTIKAYWQTVMLKTQWIGELKPTKRWTDDHKKSPQNQKLAWSHKKIENSSFHANCVCGLAVRLEEFMKHNTDYQLIYECIPWTPLNTALELVTSLNYEFFCAAFFLHVWSELQASASRQTRWCQKGL